MMLKFLRNLTQSTSNVHQPSRKTRTFPLIDIFIQVDEINLLISIDYFLAK